jgi:hemerythrin-like domain-containing protein
MLPAGPLMVEHRLIEKMIALMKNALSKAKKTNAIDCAFIPLALDFLKIYADRVHHGKEEDILFKTLAKKLMTPEHKKIMADLLREHVTARAQVKQLVQAYNTYAEGNTQALKDIIASLESLTTLYPRHIEIEDKHFFLPVMDYLNAKEQETMLEEFEQFDRRVLHKDYKKVIDAAHEEFE